MLPKRQVGESQRRVYASRYRRAASEMSPESSAKTASLYSLRKIHPSLLNQLMSETVRVLLEGKEEGREERALTIGCKVEEGGG